MKAPEARKIVSKSKYLKEGNVMTNLKYIKAYAHLIEASKLIGWKDLSYTIKRFQQFEHPEGCRFWDNRSTAEQQYYNDRLSEQVSKEKTLVGVQQNLDRRQRL